MRILYVIRRKSDGLYRLKSRWHAEERKWGDLDKAQLFKNHEGCRYAVRSNLYETAVRHPWDPWVPPTFHPEWFDQKYDILPVTVQLATINGDSRP